MATNVEIDPELIGDALTLGGKRAKREVIEEALREYVARRKQQRVLSLFGQVDYDPTLNVESHSSSDSSSSIKSA
jgi:Arc/MetJ family transcription regulator